jgi:leucyl-tRNA synthetase
VDATRMYALFAAPPDRDLDWQEDGVAGILRFLARVYRLTMKFAPVCKSTQVYFLSNETELYGPEEAGLLRTLHQTIAKVTEDFSGRWHFNTSIAAIMILVNEIQSAEAAMDDGRCSPAVIKHLFRSLALMLAPFAPFLAAELWQQLGETTVVFKQAWPEADAELARESEIEVPVQVSGKLVVVIKVAADSDEEALKAAAMADEKVAARLVGETVVKTIVVKGRMVNLVVR